MGRIAEALRKAERERQEAMESASCAPAVATAEPESPPAAASYATPPPVVEDQAPPGEPLQAVHPVRLPSEGMSDALVAYYDSSSMIAEQYRSLRTRLLSMNPNNDPRILAITSAVPREGKSVTAANLAMILAEVKHLRVMVIDGDFRRSSLAQLLNQKASPGLADVLRGAATYGEVVQSTPLTNLFFIAAGKKGESSAAEILSSERMTSVFRKIQSRYDYVIVDTPPATTVTDVGIIGQLCHAVLMVIRMNRTPGPLVHRAVRMLQVNNIPVAGCILVGNDERSVRYGYYPYYHYYKDYYGKDAK